MSYENLISPNPVIDNQGHDDFLGRTYISVATAVLTTPTHILKNWRKSYFNQICVRRLQNRDYAWLAYRLGQIDGELHIRERNGSLQNS